LCKQKADDSNTFINGTISLATSKNLRLVYSHQSPLKNIIKFDPFLSLYLVKSEKSFAYPFLFVKKNKNKSLLISKDKQISVNIISHQIGLNSFATLSKEVKNSSLVLTQCCNVEALGDSKGFIEKEYLKHFLKLKTIFYGDIGIRVIQKGNSIVVVSVDPFRKKLFHKGDKILELNGKKVTDASYFMRKILFSHKNQKLDIKIARDLEIFSFLSIVTQRYGGGFLSDTFLEEKGIYFDKKLEIVHLNQIAKKYHLKVGDKLLQVNTKRVKTEAQIRQAVSNSEKSLSLLIARDGFEFFVKII
jgi:hypothetical protein